MMHALASALLVLTGFAAQVSLEALGLSNPEWEAWTGLIVVVGLAGFVISLWRGQ